MKKSKKLNVSFVSPSKDEIIKPERGVVLCAIGNTLYYYMAAHLAAGIKSHDNNISITLVCNDTELLCLEEDEIKLFDKIIKLESEYINGNTGLDYFKFKYHLPEISPYKKTLYLDVDMQWNLHKSPNELFDLLDGQDFVIANRGILNCDNDSLRSQWCDLKEVKEVYKLPQVYDLSSELIYFEKPFVFQKALEVYKENKITVKTFGIGKADEPYFMVALGLMNYKLKDAPFFPTYWQPYHKGIMHKEEFIYSHYATSIGGAFLQPNTERIYKALTGNYYFKLNLRAKPKNLPAKSKVLKERRLI